MPQSMTGFARIEQNFDWGAISCELRSVNHRFLEVQFRLPELLRDTEFALRDALKAVLQRGKVDCSIHIQQRKGDEDQPQLNREKALAYIEMMKEISALLERPAPIDPSVVLNAPGVLVQREQDKEVITQQAQQVFGAALKELFGHRQREGEQLALMIHQRLEAIRAQMEIVRPALPLIRANQQQRLVEKLNELKQELNTDRLEQELVYIAQRMDVDEELDRLTTHLTEIERTLQQDGSIGRRLDFLMQELNREANTLGSKSQAVLSTNVAIELKVLIEQMREQIQNIE